MDFFKAAIEQVKKRRSDKEFFASQVFFDALNKSPKLMETEKALRELSLEYAKQKANDITPNKELLNKIEALSLIRSKLLNELNITDKMLNPEPECLICNDSGWHNQKPCRCVMALAINNDQNIKIPLHSFSECNLELYPKTVRKINADIFETVKKITNLYPLNKRATLVISGPSGTGKTFLGGCAANEMLERGFSVTAITAFELVNRSLKYHTTFDDTKISHLEPILESDLLIIDDLGFESIFKNITLQYLFMIINERMLSKKLTLITTNLSKDGLLNRYDESILSRLFDKEKSYFTVLVGNDKRITK